MPCYHPIKAYRVGDRENRKTEVVFSALRGANVLHELTLPCGSCIGCKMERSRQWAVRCVHESQLYQDNCFITLTYNSEHLPDGREIDYRDFQLFMKRLRKRFTYRVKRKYFGPVGSKIIRFFACGEYGETYTRPHFHAVIFNLDFDDRVYFKTSPSGAKIYTSKTLDSIWTDKAGNSIGYATVSDCNFATAAYVARYVFKKELSDNSKYDYIDPETGEVHSREPELLRMSLRPGIGAGFYEKYKSDMFPHDYCVIEGKQMKPPKFYYKKLAEDDGFMYDAIQYEREIRSRERSEDNTPERMEVKEKVLTARLSFLKRELK